MPWLLATLTLLVAYLIGAIPFGYLLARARGINIFEHGSGNIGATNVGRALGFRYGILVFILDFAKGAGSVALALWIKPHFADPIWTGGYIEVAAGLCAFLGHIFPIYLRFHGGKGVAAGCGAVFVLMPMPTLIALAVWAVLLIATRLMSLAALVAVFVLCVAHLRDSSAWDWRNPRTTFCIVAGVMVILRHRANIVRLIQGTENQLKDTPIMQQLTKSLHVLALGLWFGSAVFFTFVVALSLFNSFEAAAMQDPRESWFPQPTMLLAKRGDEEALKEQGSRAAGHAVGPLFVWYFALQGVCGFIALATALALLKHAGAVHRWRVNFLIAALALVVIGWPLERKVHALQGPRNQTMEAYLQDRDNAAKIAAKNAARAEFGQWHGYSILVNLACVLCVTAAMALAGNLHASTKETKGHEEPRKDEHAEGIFVKKGD
jgi:acyl phosphate:glycerol-3-phosphate acyltransferase